MKKRPAVRVAIAGGGRGSGKTSLVCALLERFPGAAALKCTHHGGMPGVTEQPERAPAADKDTRRMKEAGAGKVFLVRSGDVDEKKHLRRALELAGDASPVFIEGGAGLRRADPDLRIFVRRSGGRDKPASDEVAAGVHLVVSEADPSTEKIALLVRKLVEGTDEGPLRSILKRTKGGSITCAAARAAASEAKASPAKIGRLCTEAGIRIDDCVLGCFGRFKTGGAARVAVLEGGLEAKQKVWLEKDGKLVMGEGRARLLKAIREEGSLNKGARKCGMSYRRAWAMIDSIEKRAGRKIVRTRIGGRSGGGTTVTPYGRDLLRYYEKLAYRSRLVLKEEERA